MTRIIFWLIIFGIAMAFLESAIVIYLRKIYYPDGFHLPIRIIEPDVALVEIIREAATLIMLVAIGILAGKTRIQRFAFFLLCFGVWDIFYYVFLKIFLNWPASILEPDILFLIPVPWIGPVLAPVILSSVMITLAFVCIWKELKTQQKFISRQHLLLMVTGSVIVISSFVYNFEKYLVRTPVIDDAITTGTSFPDFNWLLFGTGIIFFLIPILSLIKYEHAITD